jgi:AcrR family transcriptional regulator
MITRRALDSTDVIRAEERILAAATEEFADNGFFGARTQAIADAAAVNKAMLHYYFRSKENLYSQVIKAAFGRILKQVGRAWLGPEPMTERVEMVIDSYMDSYEKNPGFLKIVLREVVDGGQPSGHHRTSLLRAEPGHARHCSYHHQSHRHVCYQLCQSPLFGKCGPLRYL